jgi:hypothetical protein
VESSDEFGTNLELLKIAYSLNCKELTRDITIYAMQPIESIEIINYSSNLDSKNTRRQIKQLTRGFISRSSESPPVIPTSPLRKLELLTGPTPSQVSFNRFSHFTSSCFFPFRGEADLHILSQDSPHDWEL